MKHRDEARKVIKDSKKESWRRFFGTLGAETTVKQVWNMTHRMLSINKG